MKILIVGVGAIGGYFGGRLLEKGADVTFLVRERRQRQLQEHGLAVESIHGNIHLSDPKTILAGENQKPYDVILLSTKSYHLEGALESITPYVGSETMILPLLNGVAHLDVLTEAFGQEKVLGGLCFIETTLDEFGKVNQTSAIHDLVFGERNGETTERILKLQTVFAGTNASFRLSETIDQDIWHKYLFIAALSGITSLFRSPIGPIRQQQQAAETIQRLIGEVYEIMTKMGAPVAENAIQVTMDKIEAIGHNMKSSLQRDMEKHLPTESDHLFGYLLNSAAKLKIPAPTLSTIIANIKIYEQTIKPR